MGLFDFMTRSAKEAKASQAHAIVTRPGEPVWMDQRYRAYAEEGYARNVIAYQSINAIADAVASVPLGVWSGETEVEGTYLNDILDRPNQAQSMQELIRAKVGYHFIAGNSFDESVDIGGDPKELYTLRPDRMKVIPGEGGMVAAYEYEVNGRKVRFDVDPISGDSLIRHMKMFNPLHDWMGQSPFASGAFGVDQHNEASNWIKSLLQNAATPSGALVNSAETSMSDEQFSRLKAQMEDQYQGSRNAGRPMLLEGGLDWKPMGLSPANMDIINTKYSAARDIALAFGVPPMLLGIPGDNTYANYSEARLAFWEDSTLR